MKINLTYVIILLFSILFGTAVWWVGFFNAIIWAVILAAVMGLYLKLSGRI